MIHRGRVLFGLAIFCTAVSSAAGQHPRDVLLEVPPPPASVELRDDWPFVLPPGWFVELGAAPVWTHIDLGIYGPPPPTLNQLDWTVLTMAAIGYRFESGGAVRFDYRYLSDTANANTLVGEPFTEDHITFLSQEFTLDYESCVYRMLHGVAVQWEAGVRIADLHYATRLHFDDQEADQVRQTMVGAGPHLGLKPAWQMGGTGLTLFGLIDGSELVGVRTQRWNSIVMNGPGALTPSSYTDEGLSAALTIGWELGLSYTPAAMHWLRISGGYQGECLFWVGRSFTEQGPFLRLAAGF